MKKKVTVHQFKLAAHMNFILHKNFVNVSVPDQIKLWYTFFFFYKITSLSIIHSVEHLTLSMLTISMYVYKSTIDFLQIKIVMDCNQQSQTVHPGYHMMTPDVHAEEDSEDYV